MAVAVYPLWIEAIAKFTTDAFRQGPVRGPSFGTQRGRSGGTCGAGADGVAAGGDGCTSLRMRVRAWSDCKVDCQQRAVSAHVLEPDAVLLERRRAPRRQPGAPPGRALATGTPGNVAASPGVPPGLNEAVGARTIRCACRAARRSPRPTSPRGWTWSMNWRAPPRRWRVRTETYVRNARPHQP